MINIKPVILVFFNCFLLVTGQILWKIGLDKVRFNGLRDVLNLISNKYISLGMFVYVISTFYWFYILKRFSLSKVYPLQSFSYVLAPIFGYFILEESITKNSIIGTIFICIGVFFIAK
ncbi:EamA family transporter [Clostridium sp.]|uniref:EamA family transporter n=1 Tax=Clostridium sp. TaxID=1506 RepID=UPI002FC9B32F